MLAVLAEPEIESSWAAAALLVGQEKRLASYRSQ